jgi:hypothetical protein
LRAPSAEENSEEKKSHDEQEGTPVPQEPDREAQEHENGCDHESDPEPPPESTIEKVFHFAPSESEDLADSINPSATFAVVGPHSTNHPTQQMRTMMVMTVAINPKQESTRKAIALNGNFMRSIRSPIVVSFRALHPIVALSAFRLHGASDVADGPEPARVPEVPLPHGVAHDGGAAALEEPPGTALGQPVLRVDRPSHRVPVHHRTPALQTGRKPNSVCRFEGIIL